MDDQGTMLIDTIQGVFPFCQCKTLPETQPSSSLPESVVGAVKPSVHAVDVQ